MKLRFVAVAAACAASLNLGSAGAQAVFTHVTGQEFFNGFAEGVVNCRGSVQPSGQFFLPCGEGIPGSIRGRRVSAIEVSSDPRVNGTEVIVVNSNFDANGEGPMWGTFELTLAAGGVVEGTYSGTANVLNSTMQLEVIGHGRDGVADGLQYKVDDVHDVPYGLSPGTLSIRILGPGGK